MNLAKEKVDFIVLDEIHFVKKRDEESNQRRRNLDGLMTAIRKKNSNVKVLGLSATPVVNNLMEGRSLLELITGKIYDDVATTPTIPNAVTLYEKLSLASIRELPKYDADVHTEHIDVKTQIPRNNIISIKELKRNPLTIERFLSDAKIPEIIRHIEDQTIIYTEYDNLCFQDIDKFLALLTNAKDNGFDGEKIVARLKKIQSLENKEERLKHQCEILSGQVKKCNNVLPLAQKMRAMNIDIQELLVFDTAVNQIAKQYNLPPSVAALRLFNDIKDYNKIGGLTREISRLCQQIFVVNGICANQNKAMMAMINLQSRGITEDRILYINNILENNGYKDMKLIRDSRIHV